MALSTHETFSEEPSSGTYPIAAIDGRGHVEVDCEPTAEEVAQYLPLVEQVVGVVLQRLPPNVLREDMVAAGTFGLLDALRRHHSPRGEEFTWYARIRIRGAVVDELRSQDWLSRRARRRFADENRQASSAAVIGIDDLPEERRTVADRNSLTPESLALAHSDHLALARAVGQLPERERNIITQHYIEGVQLRAIARELGVSEPRVSQLHARAVARLREILAA